MRRGRWLVRGWLRTRGRRPHVAVVSEQMHAAGGAVRAEQLDHRLVGVGNRAAQCVRRAFDFRIRVGSVFQQQLGDVEVLVGDGRVQGVAVGCDSFFGQVRIGAAGQEQLDDLDMPAGGGVFERCAGASGSTNVLGHAVGERGILVQQLAHAVEIADVARGADIAIGARAEMVSALRRRGGPFRRHVASRGSDNRRWSVGWAGRRRSAAR